MFDAVYDSYKTAVYAFAYRLTQNRGEAEDLFQETWLRVAQNFPKVLDMKKIKAWLFTIAANLHKDVLRKKRIRRVFLFQRKWEFDQIWDCSGDTSALSSSDKASVSERMEIGRDISLAIAKLSAPQRLIFILKEVEGFTQLEISEMLGMPVGTVKSLMYRAVQSLRRDLTAYHPKKIKKNGRSPNEMQRG